MITELVYDWIDLLWLPVTWFAVHKHQRLKSILFVLACIFVLRLQIELLYSIGYPTGILEISSMPLYHRGLITYGIGISAFLILAHFSPRTKGFIYMAACLSSFILIFCISMGFMVL